MCTLDAEGRHTDTGAKGGGDFDNLVGGVIIQIPAVAPAREALVALVRVGLSERTQGWFLKKFNR